MYLDVSREDVQNLPIHFHHSSCEISSAPASLLVSAKYLGFPMLSTWKGHIDLMIPGWLLDLLPWGGGPM